MAEPSAWFERKFRFDLPVELFPNVLIRLRGTPARLEELTAPLDRESLVLKPGGKWSVQENAGHLLELEPLWSGRIDDLLAGATTLRAADLSNRATDEARYNERPLAAILPAFRRSRLALLERMERLEAQDFARNSLHPRLQAPMRLLDHLYFVAEHDDHHLARIWAMIHPRPWLDPPPARP